MHYDAEEPQPSNMPFTEEQFRRQYDGAELIGSIRALRAGLALPVLNGVVRRPDSIDLVFTHADTSLVVEINESGFVVDEGEGEPVYALAHAAKLVGILVTAVDSYLEKLGESVGLGCPFWAKDVPQSRSSRRLRYFALPDIGVGIDHVVEEQPLGDNAEFATMLTVPGADPEQPDPPYPPDLKIRYALNDFDTDSGDRQRFLTLGIICGQVGSIGASEGVNGEGTASLHLPGLNSDGPHFQETWQPEQTINGLQACIDHMRQLSQQLPD